MNTSTQQERSARTLDALRLAELTRLADAVELAALDLISGHDPFGERCRRCGLGHVDELRNALARYRRGRESMAVT